MTDIRYNCKLENQIVFSLVGANKSIGCPIIFYEELLRRSKIKKIKHAELIDETTYRKYFRMRGFKKRGMSCIFAPFLGIHYIDSAKARILINDCMY
jgi:hypothetical protein